MELFTPDFGLVFWMFLAFLVLFLILAKWGWPVILKSIDERADKIDKGVEYAQEAKAQLDSARADAQKYIEEAQIKQAEMLRDAAKMKSQMIEEAKTEAAREAQKVMDAAKVSIEQSRKEAELQFRNEVSKFSLEIAEKMVRNQLSNDKAQA
ncbi:MAG: F0F1 ATP synthase subunit B, partial [Muribaculaceae bacterium]|nr:F0F1 ATP synthase subunit B [Muribaculaceae bacterium]